VTRHIASANRPSAKWSSIPVPPTYATRPSITIIFRWSKWSASSGWKWIRRWPRIPPRAMKSPSFATTWAPAFRNRTYSERLLESIALPIASTATFTSRPAAARSARASTKASAIAPGRNA
jgi:hypothetical protein